MCICPSCKQVICECNLWVQQLDSLKLHKKNAVYISRCERRSTARWLLTLATADCWFNDSLPSHCTMHVFPRRCDPLVDILHTTQLGSMMRYITGWKEMLEGRKNNVISGIHEGFFFFYMSQLHGDSSATVDANLFALKELNTNFVICLQSPVSYTMHKQRCRKNWLTALSHFSIIHVASTDPC